jgi:hypothetical protein
MVLRWQVKRWRSSNSTPAAAATLAAYAVMVLQAKTHILL